MDSTIIYANEDEEELNKCIFNKENLINDENGNLISINTGEVCSIDTAKKYNIFDKDNYYLNDYVNNTNNFKDLDNNNYEYSLCSMKEDIALENCVLSTKNPWKTLNSDNKCALPLNITLPKKLSYNKDEKFKINKPEQINRYNEKTKYCQNKWYDWFVVPDYHFGNSTNQITNIDKECKCYKPCEIGMIPMIDNTTKDSYCVLKDDFNYGYYKGTFNYTPLSLILLLGCDEDVLIKMFNNNLLNMNNNNKDINIDYELYNEIQLNIATKKLIYESIKKDINKAIKDLLKLPFDYGNIIVPTPEIIKLSGFYTTKDNLEIAYGIAEKFYNYINAKTNEEMANFKDWKLKILDINGETIDSQPFNKQLLILKQSCNILFDNKTDYSTNNIFYILNKNNLVPKKPLIFNITDIDILLSVSNNNSENGINTTKLTGTDKVIKAQNDNVIINKESNKDPNSVALKQGKYNEIALNTQKNLNPVLLTDKLINGIITALKIFQIFCILCVIILFLATLINYLYEPIISVYNNLVISYMTLIYNLEDFANDKFTANKANTKIATYKLKEYKKIKINEDKR